MPPITSGKILITGANGFIAVWVIQDLLEHKFGVRGTVRSESRARHLRELFEPYGDSFEVVIVSDITKVSLPLPVVNDTLPLPTGRRIRRGPLRR